MAYVEDLGDNKHKVYVDLGRDSRGKRRRRTKTITVTSNRDLNNQVRDFELQCLQEQDEPIENITFAGFVDRWMKNHVDTKLTLTSKDTYQVVLDNNLIDYFGEMKLKDIKRFHIVEYFTKEDGKALLPTKYMVLKSIFARAMEWEVLKSNPTLYVDEPKPKNPRTVDFYTEAEIEHLLSVLDNVYPKHRIMIKLAVIGGLRRAEVAGVREECINYKENYIYVDKQLRYNKHTNEFYLAPVKNGKPRKVFFPSKFMKEIKSYVTDLKKRRMAMGNEWNPLIIEDEPVNLIIVKEDGFPSHLNSIGNEWKKITKRYDLKYITFHQLRHSCASLMVKKNKNFKVIQERLGHANIGITLNVYSHLEEEQHVDSVDAFDDIL